MTLPDEHAVMFMSFRQHAINWALSQGADQDTAELYGDHFDALDAVGEIDAHTDHRYEWPAWLAANGLDGEVRS